MAFKANKLNRVLLTLAICAGLLILFKAGSDLRKRSHGPSICEPQLRLIYFAKEYWGTENTKSSNDVPTWEDLRPYLPSVYTNAPMRCPVGGEYIIGKLGEPPQCPHGGEGHTTISWR